MGFSFRNGWCLLLVWWALAGAAAQAQPSRPLDSARAVAVARTVATPATPDTTRLRLLQPLANYYTNRHPLTALRYAEQGRRLAHHLGRRAAEVGFVATLCRLYYQRDELVPATDLARQLFRLASAPPRMPVDAANALSLLAIIRLAQDHRPEGRRLLWQAVALAEAAPPSSNRSETLSFCYSTLLTAALGATPDPAQLPDSLRREGQRAGRQALRYADDLRLRGDTARANSAVAEVWDGLSSLTTTADSARYYKTRALRVYQRQGDSTMVASRRQHLADIDINAGQYAHALELATQAARAAGRLHVTQVEADATENQAQALRGLGRSAEAYDQLVRSFALREQFLGADQRKAISALQVSFDTEHKEARIHELSQQQKLQATEAARQRQRLWALAAVLAAVLVGLGVAAALYQRVRRQRTQLAVQNDELAQARATQDRLYALIAHDLRSPVVAFTGLADLLHRYVAKGDTERLAGLGGRIRQAAQHLSELLDNLLNWAVSQRGELTPQPRPLRATELLADIAALYQNAATAADITLTTADPEGLLLRADPDMTRTILRNLAGNALKATPAGGTVALRADRDAAGRVCLRVTDSGPSLTAEALAQLNAAAPMLRVAGRDSGAGLGLLLSRSFAEAQGGSLVLGTVPAGGTEATLTLPMAA